VTNGLLKSIEHRVTTNSAAVRTTVATFIRPTADCLVGPAEEFLSEDNPPRYRTLMFRDFERIYGAVKLGTSLNLSTNNLEKSVLKEIEAKTASPL
jgi:2'-deoxymugineic-acid 2'-dioxygenase/mugineic-acid 3-dioxygenase